MDAGTLEAVWRGANAAVSHQISWAGLSRDHAGATNKKRKGLSSPSR